jgi:degradative hydroxymethylglutaryl-CoA reductase
MSKSSLVSGFYKLSPKERLQLVKELAGLSDEGCTLLLNTGSLPLDIADRMIENVIGAFPLPFAIAVNFLINDRDYLIPMVIEEPSVVAAASYTAKMVRDGKVGMRSLRLHLLLVKVMSSITPPDFSDHSLHFAASVSCSVVCVFGRYWNERVRIVGWRLGY